MNTTTIHRVPTRIIFVLALALGLSIGALAAEAPARSGFPSIAGFQVLVGDFHMHTVNSDGSLTTRERVEESHAMGCDVISITDHHTTRAYRAARALADGFGMIVLKGYETNLGRFEHLNVFGVSDSFRERGAMSEDPADGRPYYQDELRRIAADGGIVIYNHPHVGYRDPLKWAVGEGLVIGIEVKNEVVGSAWGTENSHGSNWYPEALDYAIANNLTVFANTDAHGKRSTNPPRTLMLVSERSPEGVVEAIRARRTAAWFDGLLVGREGLLADIVTASVRVGRLPKGGVALQNLSPLELKGVTDAGKRQAFELAPYGEAALTDAAPESAVTVRWDNVLTGRDTYLTTTLAPAGPVTASHGEVGR